MSDGPSITRAWLSDCVDPDVQSMFNEGLMGDDGNYLGPIFTERDSKLKTENLGGVTGFPVAALDQNEGGPVNEAIIYQLLKTSATHAKYSLAYTVSDQMAEDDLKGVIQKCPRALAAGVKYTPNLIRSTILDRAFNGSYLGADGKALCATDHPGPSGLGGTWSNSIGAVELNYSGLQTAITALENMDTFRGIPMPLKPKWLVVPTSLAWAGDKALRNSVQPDTTMRNDNAINRRFKGIELIVCPDLTGGRWFVCAAPPSEDMGLIWFWRRKIATPVSEVLGQGRGFRIYTSFRGAATFHYPKNIVGSSGV